MHFANSIDFLRSEELFMFIEAIVMFQFKAFAVSLEPMIKIIIERFLMF
jgi:hypothetical protein